jgi:hypothetical protein
VSAVEGAGSFAAARAAFEQVIEFARQAAVDEITHGQLERELSPRMREVTRVLFQDHLDLREVREARVAAPVADHEGISRNRIERHRRTGLDTVFGPVSVHRIAYRGDYVHDLHLLDAHLNLPEVKASHGLARMAVLEAVRGSFAAATEQLRAGCGVKIGSRQVKDLVVHAACDIEDFYAAASPVPAGPGTLLVLTFDGKGIVMRPEALREATAKAAAKKGANTYKTRLATGEKNGRKRMAEIAAVYDADPAVRAPTDILPEPGENEPEPAPGPLAFNKWLTGSVEHPAATTVKAAFAQARARDPHHQRPWIVLVDGAAHQIELVKAEARRRKTPVTIIVDFIHVIEYLSAPRGALLYPPPSGERLEEASLGPMAYLDSKGKGNNSMPENRRPSPGIWGGASGDPRDMAKAGLPEAQSPGGAIRTPAGKMPETGAAPCGRVHRYLPQPPGRGAMPSQGIQGDEWAA